jgi:hypothetical protein
MNTKFYIVLFQPWISSLNLREHEEEMITLSCYAKHKNVRTLADCSIMFVIDLYCSKVNGDR